MINKIDKSLASVTKRKRKTQINGIRNERVDITTHLKEIKSTKKEYLNNYKSTDHLT